MQPPKYDSVATTRLGLFYICWAFGNNLISQDTNDKIGWTKLISSSI